jgi:hypothetical protein
MLMFSLSNTPRNKLLEWYEDVCAQARGLCAAFGIAGALSLVAYPTEWNAYPGNLTNAADVLANGNPPNLRARPTFAQPADHPDDAVAAVLSVHKRAMDKYYACTMIICTLNVALLASIGLLLHLDQNEPPGGYVLNEPPGFILGIHLKR